jgi:hypothetical protein
VDFQKAVAFGGDPAIVPLLRARDEAVERDLG